MINRGYIGKSQPASRSTQNGIWKIDEKMNFQKTYILDNRDIITRGLVFWLDASNPLSYPGSGLVGYDLANTVGNVSLDSRNSDWSYSVDSATGIPAIYNSSNRVDANSPGINIPNNTGFNKAEGTIEFWIKPTDTAGGIGFFVNSDGSDYTNNANWFWFGTWDNSSVLYFRQGNASTCCNDLTVSNFAANHYTLNTWMQIAITWKVSAGSAAIYKNGSLLASTTSLPTNISTTTNPTTTGQLFNGHERGDNMQFKGYCNDYRIYNRQLSTAEILSNFNGLRSRFGI
jgi:hypothetical protein